MKFLEKFNIKLSTQFALLTTILITLIVLLMAQYMMSMLNNFVKQSEVQSMQYNKSIAAIIIDSLTNKIDTDHYGKIDTLVQNMIINNIVAYVVIADNATKLVKYSSIDNFNYKALMLLKSGSYHGKWPKELLRFKNTYYISTNIGKETIFVGFYTEPTLKLYVELLIKNITAMVVLFITLGLIIASLMSMIVTRPLNKLVDTIKDFAEGKLDKRAEKTAYSEINQLVTSYNSMAQEIQTLYTSLEQKVEERTLQLENAYKELQNTQAMMVHSEKMRSLGELVAGITHEINNPVNFIYGNLIHLHNYSLDLMNLIDKYTTYEYELEPEHRDEIVAFKKDIDLDFLKGDLPDLIRSCREGTERTKNIVMDLKNFSRMDEMVINNVNLTKEIDTTLNILHNKIKNKIEIHKEYAADIPSIEGYGGQLNQVFMNILDNAAYAIPESGDIWIRINPDGEKVKIEIEDNGTGMDPDTVKKLFDPFFTTKPPGEGTGLGMAISYKVIQNHNGSVSVKSELGKGTKFIIELPVVALAKDKKLLKEE